MSNTPIFDKLVQEFASRGKVYERLISPHLMPVDLPGVTKAVVQYAPDPYLDGPFKEPLPKRKLAPIFQTPEVDPESQKKIQEFVATVPIQILTKTPSGSFIQNFNGIRVEEDNTITLEAEVAVPQPLREHKTEEPNEDLQHHQMEVYKGIFAGPVILDEEMRYYEGGRLDPIPSQGLQLLLDASEIDQETIQATAETQDYPTYQDVLDASVKLSKTISFIDIVDGMTTADVIEELGRMFAEKYPNTEVIGVTVTDELDRGKTITVSGSTPKQTDESVNAASIEENDDEIVFAAPNFWKIRDEE